MVGRRPAAATGGGSDEERSQDGESDEPRSSVFGTMPKT